MNIEFNTIAELHKHLVDNKKSIITGKTSAIKESDGIPCTFVAYKKGDDYAVKSESSPEEINDGEMVVDVVINTTNLIDSHRDCHVKGIWKKSLEENKRLKLLKEHKATFENIISDKVLATAKTMSWKSLGFEFEGNTQALIFNARIDKDRNPYMYGQYKSGYVDNHSVGMRYVKIAMCINSDERWAADERANWDKYYPDVANKEVADEYGYFFAVIEAKVVEGSAVVFGSNYATPTLSVKTKEPLDTPKQEPSDTQISIDDFKKELQKQFKQLNV